MPTTAEILALKPRPRTETRVNAGAALDRMGFTYGTEYEYNSSSSHPDAMTPYADNETDYLDRFNFNVPPPSWVQVQELWKIARLNTNFGYPGEFKLSPLHYDHDNWMMVPHDVRKQLKKEEFPCLHQWLQEWGVSFDDVNTEEDEFGLPLAGEVFLMASGAGVSYGEVGGANTVEVSPSGLPTHNHDLLDGILKKNGTIDVVTNAVLLGLILTKTAINQTAEIGSGQGTANATASGSPTEVDIQNPFLCAGNLFINVGLESQ